MAFASVTFGTATFSKELLFWSTFNFKVLSGVLFFLGTGALKRIYLKHQIYVKKIFFKTSLHPFFKVLCYFIYREK